VLDTRGGIDNRDQPKIPGKTFYAERTLPDRGVIEPGRRADLVLIDGDPLRDITATRSIRRVWCGGAEVKPS
jgi:alpha-D-ribose 1-methylphosphonate 5-triphosphate diphosphatase PhnM